MLTCCSESSGGQGEGRQILSAGEEDALAPEPLRTDAKEVGHSLCLGHLLTTDLILSWKELFNYSMHFRPLYTQLGQNSS